jgi:Uma2 family endonuclease
VSTTIAPELESIPNRYRLPVEAYNRLSDLGFLEGRFEVLDGEVISKMGQNPPHRITVVLLVEWLSGVFGARRVQAEGPIALPVPDGIYSEPEPDVVVTREATTAYADRHPGPADVQLIVEVADTTLRTDLLLKSRLYARAGIPEYWVFDLNGRQLHVHRDPAEGEYSSVNILAEDDHIAPISAPQSLASIVDLLPPIVHQSR